MLRERYRSWWWDVALLAGLAGTTWLVAAGVTHDLDLAVRDWCLAHQPDWAYWTARALNLFGQGWLLMYVISGALTVYLLVKRRDWRWALPIVVGYFLTSATAGPMKLLTDRAAPRNPSPNAVELFQDPAGMSFPSGHVVNAIFWWGVIVLLVRQIRPVPVVLERWVRFAPPIIVLGTTTYLAFHWVTDGVAALFLGVFIWRLFLRLPWPRILPQ
ncbi:membrane-associated phospholipid phosphatase [Allocatelliglobosispora scoriae]|uniref:Membrane-associated phospholipid phosphatase n=1 Tax=Allocatelliglobosispora scoriae TaxID=643052 RepID=A0A841BU64_9ACTN|nr:phosphatase PAP2 family protein [Allocatelliglobosispora scoriae]MBB5870699.1 membrane-associated phospholipid phosphatase [Allocatelliglobosispora scoriae]